MTDKNRAKAAQSRRGFLKSAGLGTVSAAAAFTALPATTVSAQSNEPIIIGGPLPMTGGAAADGIEFKNGLEMAAEEINAAGGILGRPVKIVVADTESGGDDKITSAGQRLIDRDGAQALISGYNFGSQKALQNVAADASVVYMHCDTAPQHTDLVTSDPDRYWGSFMYCPSQNYYGDGFLGFIKGLEDSGQFTGANKKIAVVTGPIPYSINIANSIRDNAEKFGYEVSLYETVEMSTSEWGPTLAKIRDDKPGYIAVTHLFPNDQAQFMQQFLQNPTDSLIYLQYGASLGAFRDIAGDASEDVIYATSIGVLSGEVGTDFAERYVAKFGATSSPNGGVQTYEALHQFAAAAAIAGGVGVAYEDEQNKRVAARLKASIHRGANGTTRFDQTAQEAVSYPVQTRDPSLGMAHLFSQIEKKEENGKIISPPPYDVAQFRTPKWINR